MSEDDRCERGRRAEDLAARYLAAQGFDLLERNARVGRDELDLILEGRGLLAFVEVRSRAAGARFAPEGSLGAAKRAALLRAATRWLGERGRGNARCRFDLVTVRFRGEAAILRHFPGALVDEA